MITLIVIIAIAYIFGCLIPMSLISSRIDRLEREELFVTAEEAERIIRNLKEGEISSWKYDPSTEQVIVRIHKKLRRATND